MAGKTGDDDGKRETDTGSGERRKTRKSASLVSLAIARTASYPARVSSMDPDKLIPGLYEGVLLDDNKMKFWIDKKLHENCLMLFPKDFFFEGGGDENLWLRHPIKEDCFDGPVDTIEVRLNDRLSWVHFRGKFPSNLLSPLITYEVVFRLLWTEDAYGWHEPASLELTLPNGTKKSRTEIFETKPKGQLLEILVGEFVSNADNIGSIEFAFTEICQMYKTGLIIKDAIVRPKY